MHRHEGFPVNKKFESLNGLATIHRPVRALVKNNTQQPSEREYRLSNYRTHYRVDRVGFTTNTVR